MDPFLLLDQAERSGRLPGSIAKRVRDRSVYLAGAVKRVERASGLAYPPYYIEPTLPLARSGAEFGQMGVMYARVVPATSTGSLSILVQFTAALVAFGSKGTIEAVAAHEFTHYIDLVRRLSGRKFQSEERTSSLFEASYADTERTVPPGLVFSERSLVSLISRKFKDGLVDEKLNRDVNAKWIGKSLPIRVMGPEENVVRLAVGAVVAARFDPSVLEKIRSIEEKMKS